MYILSLIKQHIQGRYYECSSVLISALLLLLSQIMWIPSSQFRAGNKCKGQHKLCWSFSNVLKKKKKRYLCLRHYTDTRSVWNPRMCVHITCTSYHYSMQSYEGACYDGKLMFRFASIHGPLIRSLSCRKPHLLIT